MKQPNLPPNQRGPCPWRKLLAPAIVAAACLVAWEQSGAAEAATSSAAQPYGSKVRTAGGLNVRPVITSMAASNKQLTIKWSGTGGPYQVDLSPAIAGGEWKKLGTVSSGTSFSFSADSSTGFLRVTGQEPSYAGAETCLECHEGRHTDWSKTAHARAFETLKAIKQDKNASCLPCHTLGFGFSTGFKDETATPSFAGVQCENCHGPAAAHAMKPGDLSLRPTKTLSANVCGGCHTDAQHPTFEEWETTLHSEVTPTPANYFRQYGEARIASCGACHSGSARMAMLKGAKLPSGEEAAAVGVTCAVCHDPHSNTHPAQLRNPQKSLQPFSYSTSTNTTFAAQYDAKLNLCGQCHNSRGATWKDTSRYPHYSPQYNIFAGNGGVEVGVVAQSKHRDGEKGCAECHVHRRVTENPTETNPNYTGHHFKPHLEACAKCHKDGAAPSLLAATQTEVKQRLAAVKALLDTWAKTKAPEALRSKYGALAWEYNTVGALSNPDRIATMVGPTSAEQAAIPDNIKQARFNLYLVKQDGSYGVHNANYAKYLIKVAEDKVNAELGVKPLSVGDRASLDLD